VAWIDEFAEALGQAPLGPEERRRILDLARVVAHRTERVNAPLASYLLGRFAAARPDVAEAVAEAARLAEAWLPPPQEPAGR
jgi:Domain of unknown function (DUF6457)